MASYGNNTFQYGADGIRYKKNNTVYTLDSNKILQETDGTKTIKYYYGNGGVIGFNYNETDYYYEKNLQGDITAIYNASGLKQAEYVYDAWGKILSMPDSAGNDISNNISHVGYLNPFRYRGYYYDVETNLYYLESRYYDPETGRFLNADSLKYLGKGAELRNYNLYVYCGDNPVVRKDPKGSSWLYYWQQKIRNFVGNIWDSAVALITGVEFEAGVGVGVGIDVEAGGVLEFSAVAKRSGKVKLDRQGFDWGVEDLQQLAMGSPLIEGLSIELVNEGQFESIITEEVEIYDESENGATVEIIGVQAYFLIGGEFSVSYNISSVKERLADIWND